MMKINYQIEKSQFGFVLMVSYQDELCGVEFCQEETPLIIGLTHKFQNKDGVEFKQFLNNTSLVKDIMSVIENGETINIPYRLLGTPFQIQVWQEIAKIHCGQIKTYGEIASAIGNPKAYRAVGTACNHNHLGVIVPCHRVVPADGSMGKYAWGEVMKNQLLKREGVDVNKFKFVMRKPKKFASMHDEICWAEDKNFFKEIYEASRSTNNI